MSGVTKADLWRKRKQIERGQLKGWSRRGQTKQDQGRHVRNTILRTGLRLLRLRTRGERNALTPVVRRVDFTFQTLPASFDGFKILHLTDIHADGLAGLAEGLRDRLSDLEVDLCILTGDYRFGVSGPCDNVYPNMACILSGVQAQYGTVGILGNHDCAEMVPAFERLGVKMLVNTSLEIRHGAHSLWLVGLDDPHYYGCDDLPGALQDIPQHAFKILLVHTPEMIEDAARHGIHLYLCGHTHGGQICLPLLGPLITHARCPRQYTRGMWQHQQVQGYTSPGVGTSGVPVRFLCPPEIGLIELHSTALAPTNHTANGAHRSHMSSAPSSAGQR